MMNFNYEASGGSFDLSFLAPLMILPLFVMTGAIFYKGRTRMFLSIFSFALFWIIAPVFFQAISSLYIGLIFSGTFLITFAFWKGYISLKKMVAFTATLFGLGGFFVYLYSDIYGQALYDWGTTWILSRVEDAEAPSILPWDETRAVMDSFGGPGIFLLIIISIVAVTFFVYQRFEPFSLSASDEEDEDEGEEIESDISSTVDKAISELHEGKDIESTIMRCYQRMCLILEEEGAENEEFMTPREFEKSATENLAVPTSKVSDIREIFEMAKYSSHQLDEEMKERVVKDLRDLRNELE